MCYARNTVGQASKQFTLIVLESESITTTTIAYETIQSKQMFFSIFANNFYVMNSFLI